MIVHVHTALTPLHPSLLYQAEQGSLRSYKEHVTVELRLEFCPRL